MGPILIVDDSSADRFLIKKALLTQQSDLKLIELETGHDVVNVIKKNNPVATLLDVRMPGIDGFDTLKMIRQEQGLEDHKVLMLSGSEEPSDIKIAQESGANIFLTKPASFAEYTELAKSINTIVFGI